MNFEDWVSYYSRYKLVIDEHVVVDNNSDLDYFNMITAYFTSSKIIRRDVNGGVTAAFNDGIKFLSTCEDVGFILLIVPDIDISVESISLLRDTLRLNDRVGVVAPLLFDVHGNVEIYGGEITHYFTARYQNGGYLGKLRDLPNFLDASFIPGGICMSKLETYNKVGLQDESLFMYSDEVDWMYRVGEQGIKALFVRDAHAFHNHKNASSDLYRSDLAYFLLNRNIYILCWKHGNLGLVLVAISKQISKVSFQSLGMLKRGFYFKFIASWIGVFYGVLNIKSIPKFLTN